VGLAAQLAVGANHALEGIVHQRVAIRTLQVGRQLFHRGELEHFHGGDFTTQLDAHGGHHLEQLERVAAQVEEVVADAYTVDVQNLLPHGAQLALQRGLRVHQHFGQFGACVDHRGQCLAVNLAVGRQRHGV